MGEDTAVKDPQITLKCDCGAEAFVGYGERWTCPKCGKSYDTSHIPSSDYARILSLNKRYRIIIWAIVSVMAGIVLLVALTGQIISIFAGLAVSLLGWFLFIKPLIHRRHKRAVSDMTIHWDIQAEPAASGSLTPKTEA